MPFFIIFAIYRRAIYLTIVRQKYHCQTSIMSLNYCVLLICQWPVFDPKWPDLHIINKYIFTTIMADLQMWLLLFLSVNEDFCLILVRDFDPRWPIFEPNLYIINTNTVIKNYDDWLLASDDADLDQEITKTNILTYWPQNTKGVV